MKVSVGTLIMPLDKWNDSKLIQPPPGEFVIGFWPLGSSGNDGGAVVVCFRNGRWSTQKGGDIPVSKWIPASPVFSWMANDEDNGESPKSRPGTPQKKAKKKK